MLQELKVQTLKPDPGFQSQRSSLSGWAASDKTLHPLDLHFTSPKRLPKAPSQGGREGEKLLLVGQGCLGQSSSVVPGRVCWEAARTRVGGHVPHPKLPFGRKECGATGGQRLGMRYPEKHSPDSRLLSETSLLDPSTCYILSTCNYLTNFQNHSDGLHLTDEDIEAPRGEIPCPGVPASEVLEQGLTEAAAGHAAPQPH